MRIRRQRTKGLPRSSNGASSMHVHWQATANEISATLEVRRPPSTPHLHFWALQVSFVDRGRRLGGAHLGLQWHPSHPGATAVCWGGYRADGSGELDGEESRLPSATANPNTRDLDWQPYVPYRLRITADGDGFVDDVLVRRLHVGGATAVTSPVVWSEVFAPCDAPSTVVRWSDLSPRPAGNVQLTYQSYADGGCTNARTSPDGDGAWIQVTNAAG